VSKHANIYKTKGVVGKEADCYGVKWRASVKMTIILLVQSIAASTDPQKHYQLLKHYPV
jgi:hypothetical protein